MSQQNLLLKRFVVSKSGGFIYNQEFHEGVNIIRGVNGTGKSTIADLLSFALGAIITEWTDEQLSCDWVLAEVVLNGKTFCVKREITETGKSRMAIFEGVFELAIANLLDWTEYSVSRSDERHSFSQQIFELLGLPRYKTDDSNNLTLHQILRLMYVDQLTATTKLLKEDKNYDNPTIRKAIGDYLLGIDDLEAHNLRQELINANKDFEKLNGELNAIYKLFGSEASLINMQALTNQIVEASNELEKLMHKKQEMINSQYLDELNESASERARALQSEINGLVVVKQTIESQRSEIASELLDTQSFISSLEDRKDGLEQSRLTFTSLGQVNFKYCPSCLEPISEGTHLGCSLCKTEIKDGKRDFAYIQLLNQLNFQIRESQALVINFQDKLNHFELSLPDINRRLSEAKYELKQFETTVNPKDALLAEIASEMGFIKSSIISLEERKGHVNKVESLRQQKEQANDVITKIKDQLEQVNAKQASRYNYVYSSIETIARDILEKDGGYEPTFDNAEEVSFDFSKDKMFVNGRSKFSASSMVVMKNSIRLAIFLHTVQDKLARLPNFFIMDNIEDKGMVDERSHNFQQIIVDECEKLTEPYQLIFTTSMINPELEGSTLCVGPMYEKGSHTLEFTKAT